VSRYSTGRELNTFSALIQNYYSQETNPYQAIHLTVDTGEQSEELGVKAYIGYILNDFNIDSIVLMCPFSSPIGVQARPDNCMFVPIPVHLRNLEADRPGRA
jgi:translation initiation factor 3 subunit F